MFEVVENKYRPIPFWSWNEKLNTEETKRQIRMMEEAGIGGFFMHARGGLETEYMGEEWFDNVTVSVEEAEELGMHAWAYDENGWPSGFGDGRVNGMGIDFQQKYLRFEEGEKQTERMICNKDGYHFYYDVNPFYVDTLNDAATRMFIEEIYQPYYDKYQGRIEGFFTDEPQISRNGIPWSFLMPEAYKKAYGDDLLTHLIELFQPVGDYEVTRFRFWKLVTDMFSANFMKPIYDWCEEHGVKLTGHMVLEENFLSQLTSNGAVMPQYEYFHMPGMDWLGRPIKECLTPLQVSSVAHQLGKQQILSETFALCGHNVGHDELKGIFEWQMVNGITQLCQHLEGYSLRGIRKRDYPPAMYYQQPWWEDYKVFNDAMSRTGMILAQGKVEYDTLLLHPQSSAWLYFDADKNEGIQEFYQPFMDIVRSLTQKHVLFHLGDETIMERHARVEGDTLIIGTQKYKTVVMPPHRVLFDSTKRLLEEFKAGGGTVVTVEEVEENAIISCPYITYTKRGFDGFDVYYFVNSSDKTYEAQIAVGSKVLDAKTGETRSFDGKYTFRAYDSLLVIDDGTLRETCAGSSGESETEKNAAKLLDLSGEWEVTECTPNSITLDRCDYYFDGELVEENGYVLNIQNRACALKRPVDICCEYTLEAEYIPEQVYLACETPEKFEIMINDCPVEKIVNGYFRDKAFRTIEIGKYLRVGSNKITMSIHYVQSEKVYDNLEKAKVFESEKNKLTYDTEIEAIYIIGDFSVKCDGAFCPLERKAYRYGGNFVMAAPVEKLTLKNIEQQGYTFFAGKMKLQKTFELTDINYCLRFEKTGINVIKVKVNDCEEQTLMWEPFELDISKWLKVGENKVEITIINNLRNLLGPHHLKIGESVAVGPSLFYKEGCVWNGGVDLKEWNDEYCFVEMSL